MHADEVHRQGGVVARTGALLASKHHWFAAALLVACFFPLIWISQYNYPSGDDFIHLLKAQKQGPFAATAEWYLSWSGRYSAFFILFALGGSTNWLLIYKLAPIFLLVGAFLCSWAFIRALLGERLHPRAVFSMAACFYVLLVSMLPDITTLFYWAASSVLYAGGLFLSVLAVSVRLRLDQVTSSSHKLGLAIVLSLLAAAVAGFNEVSLLALLAVLGSAVAVGFINHGASRWRDASIFGLAATFAATALLAPGNAVRAGRAAGGADVVSASLGSMGFAAYLFIELFATTTLLPASLVYLAFLEKNRPALEPFLSKWASTPARLVLFALVGVTVLITIPVFMAIGLTGTVSRLKNVYVVSLTFGWLFFLTVAAARKWSEGRSVGAPGWLVAFLGGFILLHIATGSQIAVGRSNVIPSAKGLQLGFSLLETRSVYSTAYLDILSGRAARFAAANATRERILKEATGDSVELPLYSFVPRTIFVQDLNHRFGAPREMTEVLSGRAREVRYVETGPPPQAKERF